MSHAQAQLAALATNAALLRRSGSELNAELCKPATTPAMPDPASASAATATTTQAQQLPSNDTSNSSKALIHALECLQNKIKSMETQKAAMVSDFESQKTRSAGELAELRLLCSRQEQELAELRRHSDDRIEQARTSEQAAVDAWEKTGVLNAALARANAQVEQVSQQLQLRDEELAAIREQLSRASDAVSNAGSRAAEYSDRVTETASELSHARAELHAARLESEAAQERAAAAERMLQELRSSAAAASEAEKTERARAEYASASLRSILNLSTHAAAELPRELQYGLPTDVPSWMADPLTAATQLSASQPEPQPEPRLDCSDESQINSANQSFTDRVSQHSSSTIDPHSSNEHQSSVPGHTTAAAMAASAAAAAAQQMGPRIPGLPGYYLDVRAKLDPKYKPVRDRAEKIAGHSQQVWVPAGPALSDGRRAPASPNSRHTASMHSSDIRRGSSSAKKSKAPKSKGRGRQSRRPASAPARRSRVARASVGGATRSSTPRANQERKKGGSRKQLKSSDASRSRMRKSTDQRNNAMSVNPSASVEKQIAALATACEGAQPDRTQACERLIATTRAEIDVSASYICECLECKIWRTCLHIYRGYASASVDCGNSTGSSNSKPACVPQSLNRSAVHATGTTDSMLLMLNIQQKMIQLEAAESCLRSLSG
eukprot:COSAG02_NODE_1530_length_12086_cov_80.633103_7_plen_666_part_00